MQWSLVALPAALLLSAPVLAEPTDEIHWAIVGPTAVSFDWRGIDTAITFGTSSGVYTQTVTAVPPAPYPDGPGPYWEAHIRGLQPNRLYYYRIGTLPEHTFRTPPPRGSAGFWFAEEADVGASTTYPQVVGTQDSIAVDELHVPGTDRPAFVIAAGDLGYGDQDGALSTDQHFTDVMSWSQDAAYMPAWGNHEWDPAGSVKPDQINNWKGRFDLPDPKLSPDSDTTCIEDNFVPGKDWYWFDYGNIRFIARPPSSEGACGYSAAQAAWTASADSLMHDVDHDAQIRFIITYGHFPAYSSGADHGGDPSLAADFEALHAAHPKYVLSICAHSHHYERFDPARTGGLLEVIGPGGGSTLGGLSTALPSTVVRFNHLEHLKIHVSDDRLDAYCVCGPSRPEESSSCVLGTVIDSWSIVLADSIAPRVQLTSPVGGGTWTSGETVPISWTATDNVGVSGVDMLLSRSGPAGPFDPLVLGLPNTGSTKWQVSGSSTANAVMRVVAHDPSGNTGSASSGVFTIGSVVGVPEGPITQLALAPVSPNPVRGATRFELALPHDTSVRLGLFDALGRERAVLANGTFTAGRHDLDWNADSRRDLAPGLYFVRLRTSGGMISRAFVLMR
jgi:hypothetical protein